MFFCSVLSFFGGLLSPHGIEVLEASKLIVLSRRQIDKLCNKHHDMQKLYTQILTYGLITAQKNIIDQRFKTAEERYVVLVRTCAELIHRIPLKYIASCLGITQETLSRIRANAII